MHSSNPATTSEHKSPSPASSPGHAVVFINESDYTVDKSRRLGKGGLGEVFIGEYHGAEIAVKELLLEADAICEETKQNIEREAGMMVGLRHPNVVQFLGIGARGYAILMEYMPNRSLFHLLQNGQPIAWEIIVQIAKDITAGLSYLHAQKIVHQDLKSLNVLLGRDLRAKLSDFGMAKVKQDTLSLKSSGGSRGTPAWTAPEVLCGEASANYESDVYSLGMIFWELFAKKTPFAGVNPFALAFQLKAGKREEIPSDTKEPFRAIITQCWQPAGQRPKAVEIAGRLREIRAAEEAEIIAEVEERPEENTFETAEPVSTVPMVAKFQSLAAAKSVTPAIDVAEITAFLKLVAEGEEDDAEAALRVKRELALCAGDITDLSGRTFHNITALQYAVWALDWRMWEMIISYMDREDITNQLNGVETGSWVAAHELNAKHLIDNLLQQLQVYTDNFDAWYKSSDWNSIKEQWNVKVGTAQRMLPVHVINEYCHPKETLDPMPDFKSATRYQPGWRSRQTEAGEWFAVAYHRIRGLEYGGGVVPRQQPGARIGARVQGCPDVRPLMVTPATLPARRHSPKKEGHEYGERWNGGILERRRTGDLYTIHEAYDLCVKCFGYCGRNPKPTYSYSFLGLGLPDYYPSHACPGVAGGCFLAPESVTGGASAGLSSIKNLLVTRLQQHAELVDAYKPTAGHRPPVK